MINNITEFKVIDKEFGYGTEIGDKFTYDSKIKYTSMRVIQVNLLKIIPILHAVK